MRTVMVMFCALLGLGCLENPVVAQGIPKAPAAEAKVLVTDVHHLGQLEKMLRTNGVSVANCFKCHVKAPQSEADRALQITELQAELNRLQQEDHWYLARVKVESAEGRVVSSPQLVLKSGTKAGVSFEERTIGCEIRVEAAVRDQQHKVEVSVFTEEGDGSRSHLSNLSFVVPTGKEWKAEVNGYKVIVKISPQK